MPRPTLNELARECDAWRELAEAFFRQILKPSPQNMALCDKARDRLTALGISMDSPGAMTRVRETLEMPKAEVESLRAASVRPPPMEEGEEVEVEFPSPIANVIGDCLDVGPKK